MGIDLSTYPSNWTNNWIIAYGIYGKTSSIDPQKTYDFHTAFDIQPTQVVYNVPINMNRKRILNIALDKNISNSAATVKIVIWRQNWALRQRIKCIGKYLKNFMILVMLVNIN